MKKILIILTLLLLNLFICQNSVYSKTTPYRIVQDPEGVYIVEVNTAKSSLVPYVSEKLETNENVYKKTGAKLVINAGFFDPKNQKTVSYITINGNLKESPENNENLMITTTPTFILTSSNIIEDFEEELRDKGLNENLSLQTNLEQQENATSTISNVKNFAITFLILTFIIGTIVLLVINMINIRERRYEIGVLRTIGMKSQKFVYNF